MFVELHSLDEITIHPQQMTLVPIDLTTLGGLTGLTGLIVEVPEVADRGGRVVSGLLGPEDPSVTHVRLMNQSFTALHVARGEMIARLIVIGTKT